MNKLYSLRNKLFGIGGFIIIVTATLIFAIGYQVAKKAIVDEAQRHVLSVALERRARLETWLDERLRTTEVIANSFTVYSFIKKHELKTENRSKDHKVSPDQLFQNINLDKSIQTAYLFDKNREIIAYAPSDSSSTLGVSEIDFELSLSKNSTFGPIHLNSKNVPVINFLSNTLNHEQKSVGSLLCQYSTEHTINPILADTTGLGFSGEAFLVDSDTVMVTPSRFHEHPTHLTHKMPIPTVLAGLNGQTGSMVYNGFLGNDVVGAYTYMPDQKWVIVVEMRIEEAFEPLRAIITNTLLATTFALVGMLIIASILARAWTLPLERLASASEKVGEGDFTVQIESSKRDDEIGTLIKMFNNMVNGISTSREQLKISHQRLLQSEKLAAIGRLVAGIVHEMRNPLSAIKMNLRLLERKEEKNSEASEHIMIASEEAIRLERMFDEVLDYSKPPILKLEKTDPIDLVDRAITNLKDLAETSQIELELKKINLENSDFVLCDKDKMLQVLVNLIQNAIQASDKNSSVRITVAKEPPDSITFEIVDEGSGMSENVIQRIYEPFYTTKENGIGLGMNNVKKLVDAHFGKLKIKSSIGEGTSVVVTIPKEHEDGKNPGY